MWQTVNLVIHGRFHFVFSPHTNVMAISKIREILKRAMFLDVPRPSALLHVPGSFQDPAPGDNGKRSEQYADLSMRVSNS